MNLWHSLLFPVILLFSCSDSTDPELENQVSEFFPGEGFFVLNEGNFGWGEATLGYFHRESKTYYANLFQAANNRALGNVGQSMVLHEGLIYLVVNNSGTIEILDPGKGLKTVGQLTGFVSPRYFLPVSSKKAYVTDLYASSIQVVSLTDQEVTHTIPVAGWTEEMLRWGEVVLVSCRESDHLYQVLPKEDNLVDSVFVGYGSMALEMDQNGGIWVLCYGDESGSIPGRLVQLSGSTLSVEWEYVFPAGIKPQDFEIDAQGRYLYILAGSIFRLNIEDRSLEVFKEPILENWYGLESEPGLDGIWSINAMDYLQRGTITYWNHAGGQVLEFKAGVIPTQLLHY